ncbi:heme A synthase [Roseitranquillus sediminis]|uniref:heme A synthase n=1 Tax=Roseitranquillus sediminis TaxID=2809051 RepID=UPI001D0C9BBC|nr:heme A synthase [Roseitranquillus sediminis]MBM9595522.1 COX15/CtaA family protein [Roseitranquillus sediminis]
MSQKRAIFQEVESDRREQSEQAGGLIDRARPGARGALRVWLIVLFALVVVMIAVGGLTRLTDSGLSITEWRPVTGAVPPLSDADWQAEFELYQQIPEFQLQNRDMTLDDFKTIYWWEWGHRQLGRVIGLVWLVGFAGFALTRRLPPGWTGRLLLLGALGGLQGAVGWWMVSSGLGGEMLDVASYRLAVHLGLAFVILGAIAWFVMRLGRPEAALLQARRAREARLFGMSTGLLHLTFLQILLGALVAGIDAGRGYTDWPLMAGGFLPPDLFQLSPWWRNFFEDDGLVQFMHRMVAYVLFVFGLVVWRVSRRSGNGATRTAFDWMAVILFGQVVLGIVTVMSSAPWHLAILHQLGAVALWVLILRARFFAQYPLPQSVRGRG